MTSRSALVKGTSGHQATGDGTQMQKSIIGYPARGSRRPTQVCSGLLVIGHGLMAGIAGIRVIGHLKSVSTAGLITDMDIPVKVFTVAGGKEMSIATTPPSQT